MKLSFVISFQHTKFEAVGSGDFATNLLLLNELGYDGVEIAVRDPGMIDPSFLGGTLKKHDLKLAALGTGQAYIDEGLSLTHLDRGIRGQAIERIKRHIDLASLFGSLVIIGLIRGSILGPETRDRQLGFLSESITEICTYSESKGVSLAIEPINRYECNILNTARETIDLIEKNGSHSLTMLLDTFHMNIEEKDIFQTIISAQELVGHVHFADSNRRYPGMGHIDFRGVCKALYESGYTGFLSGEMLPDPAIEVAMREYIKNIREVLA
jgi:5-keto-L-gluconate epimerase